MKAIRHTQQGVVLVIAMIVMVAMTMAAIALVRVVDSGILAAANLAFRQSATLSGEVGLTTGTNWLVNIPDAATLFDNTNGYWANAQNVAPGFNPLTYDWAAAGQSVCVNAGCAPDTSGNVSRYVIHRLCESSGNPLAINCLRSPSWSSGDSGHNAVDYRRLYPNGSGGAGAGAALGGAYYRVTVRISGPRNTTSYVQAILY